jgi:hypothetical protein
MHGEDGLITVRIVETIRKGAATRGNWHSETNDVF